jgi:hypothetical protein
MGLTERVFAAPNAADSGEVDAASFVLLPDYGLRIMDGAWAFEEHPYDSFSLFSAAKLALFGSELKGISPLPTLPPPRVYPRFQGSERNHPTASVSVEAARTDCPSDRQDRFQFLDSTSAAMAVCTAQADLSSRIEFAIFVGNTTLERTEQTPRVTHIAPA